MRVAMVTGPSSGIGLVTAKELARAGFHVVAAGRSTERTRPVVESIEKKGGSAEFLHLDLASLDSARRAALSFGDSGRTLDVLVNNAGVGVARGLTEDGFEIHFGVNHLGHFMLTHHLMPTFRPGTRIVAVSSESHRSARGIDLDRVKRRTPSLFGVGEYGTSKLANILFVKEMAQRHPEWRTYAVHPGMVDTGIFPSLVRPLIRRSLLTPEQGAETVVWCATAAELADQSGLYYFRKKMWTPSPFAEDDDLALRLWQRSEEWCGIAPGFDDH